MSTGELELIGHAYINGMRGCYLSTDYNDQYLFVAGYHDGKLTVLRLKEDGSMGGITDEVYHKGLGSIAERNFRPHISCVKMTRDNKYLLAADLGMDHVNVYKFNSVTGKVKLIDVIRCEIESAPRHVKFTKDGKFLYILHELKNIIDVYTYQDTKVGPEFERIQTISTLNNYHAGGSAACTLNFSSDDNYLISSNAGDNSVVAYSVDHSTGELKKLFCLPISGDYPKDANFFPDMKHIVSLNHESNTLTFFSVDLEKGLLIMNGKSMPVDKPNCVIFQKLESN
jgi:6-phosphogluconolactonase